MFCFSFPIKLMVKLCTVDDLCKMLYFGHIYIYITHFLNETYHIKALPKMHLVLYLTLFDNCVLILDLNSKSTQIQQFSLVRASGKWVSAKTVMILFI
jgi:hypothetical protein